MINIVFFLTNVTKLISELGCRYIHIIENVQLTATCLNCIQIEMYFHEFNDGNRV